MTHQALFSVGDLFAAGIGFDLAGAALLGWGLIESPRQAARRMTRKLSRGGFNAATAKQAEDRGRAIVGLVALGLGFVLQAVGYFLTLQGHDVTARGTRGAAVAIGICLLSSGLVVAVGLLGNDRLARGFILELAHYDDSAERQSLPSARELLMYGDALMEDLRPGETPADYARRVFGVTGTRD